MEDPKCPRCNKDLRGWKPYCYWCQVPVYLDVTAVEYPKPKGR